MHPWALSKALGRFGLDCGVPFVCCQIFINRNIRNMIKISKLSVTLKYLCPCSSSIRVTIGTVPTNAVITSERPSLSCARFTCNIYARFFLNEAVHHLWTAGKFADFNPTEILHRPYQRNLRTTKKCLPSTLTTLTP